MKLVLLLAVVGVVWWWLRQRSADAPRPPPAAAVPTPPQDVLPCAHCGVHLPVGDAVAGRHGVYCSAAHRLAHGDVA